MQVAPAKETLLAGTRASGRARSRGRCAGRPSARASPRRRLAPTSSPPRSAPSRSLGAALRAATISPNSATWRLERAAVTRDREAPDDAVGGLRDEDGHVRVPLDAAHVPPLVAARPVVASARAPARPRRARPSSTSASASPGTAGRTISQSLMRARRCHARRAAGRPRRRGEPSARRSTAAAPPK